jgi:hypothetical protein
MKVNSEKKKTTVILVRGVDPKLRDKFKAICAKKGQSMKSVLLTFITGLVQ